MSWTLKNEQGHPLNNIINFKLEHAKGKPATLTWSLPTDQPMTPQNVSLWRGGECIFKGNVYDKPTHFTDGMTHWAAVAINDTFHQQRSNVIAILNQNCKLSSPLKDFEGAQAGYLHIDKITHTVSWVSLDKPQTMWDAQSLHERDSIHITPINESLKGLSASVKLTHKRLDNGMMDVGSFITSRLQNGVETYSGASLEDQWKKLEFRALRAGYDIHYSELTRTSYQRANLDKALTFLDKKNQLVSVYYNAYKVNLLLSWAIPITTHTTVTVETPLAHESITLSVKDMESAHEPDVVTETLQWMNAYALNRSFTTLVTFKVLITDDMSLSHLDARCWARIYDPRIQNNPIEGVIISYTLTHTEGVTWADVSLMWAPKASLKMGVCTNVSSSTGDAIQLPKTPDQIIAWVKVSNDATDQFEYYIANKTRSFEAFAHDFPMTQLEIGLHPLTNDTTEYVEKTYRI